MWDFGAAHLCLVPFGFLVGLIASMVGIGGGVFMVPFLMLAFDPQKFDPQHAAATSLCVIILTSLSSTTVNARRGRIDYRVAIPFAVATIPGAVFGPCLLRDVPRDTFKFCFGVLLVLTAINMVFFELQKPALPPRWGAPRRLVETDGTAHDYRIHYPLGIVASILAGFIAAMAGVGGGVVHMPVLILVFGMTPYVSSATSQFMLFLTAFMATIVNAWMGNVHLLVALFLGAGIFAGAQLGARAAGRVRKRFLKRLLGLVLLVVAAKLILQALGMFPGGAPR